MTIFNRFFAIIACIATLGLTSVSCTGDTPDGPDTEQPGNDLPGLKASHEKSNNSPQYDGIIDTSYDFDEDGNLTITRHSYLADKWNDNAIFEGSEVKEEYKWTFTGAYPYSSSGGITAMTWQDNGMPESWDSSVPETTYTWEGPYRVNHCEWLKSNVTLGIKNYKHVAGYVGGYLDDYWRTNEYDSYDALIHSSFCITNDDKAIDYYYSDYVYDSHGNWTSRKEDIMGVLDGNRSVSVLTREIEYF